MRRSNKSFRRKMRRLSRNSGYFSSKRGTRKVMRSVRRKMRKY